MATFQHVVRSRPQPLAEAMAFGGLALGISLAGALGVASAGVDMTQLEGAPAWVWPLFLLMAASPTLAALLVRLIFHGTARGFATGWRLPAGRHLARGAAIPVAYALAVHLVLWESGLAPFAPAAFLAEAQSALGAGWAPAPAIAALYALLVVGGGTLAMVLFALGEEIGYNGYLIPTLAESLGLGRAATITGLIWVACHVAPAALFGGYSYGAPLWYAIPMMAPAFLAVSFIAAAIRTRSGSIWPAVLAHAGHNVWLHLLLAPLTAATPALGYLAGDHGALTFLFSAAVAAALWRRR